MTSSEAPSQFFTPPDSGRSGSYFNLVEIAIEHIVASIVSELRQNEHPDLEFSNNASWHKFRSLMLKILDVDA